MNKITKREPLLEVITKDNKIFYTPAKNKAALFKHLNDDKFIEIDGVIINSFTIIRVQEIKKTNKTTRYL